MKLIRIGNDIQIHWTITRFNEPEDFTNKNLSVELYDKYNCKQKFDYVIEENVISGTFFGKDQKTNGVYRLFLVENEGKEDMVSLDFIDCFCISNKLKNQTSNGEDSSCINTEVIEVSSDMNTTSDLTEYARKTYVDEAIVNLHSEIEEEIPTKTSDLTNDSGFITSSILATVATSGSYNDLTNKPNLFSGNYNDLTNKPTIPTKTSQLNNDSGYITSSILATVATSGSYNDLTNKPTIPTKTSQLTNDSNYVKSNNLATVATSGSYNDLKNKPNLFSGNYNDLYNKPTIPTKTSQLTNDSGYITHANIPTKTSDLTNDSGFITGSDIPSNVSAFTNDAGYITSSILAAVATSGSYNDLIDKPTLFSGDYNDLTNKPTIPVVPTNVSAFTNDAGYVPSTALATVATSGDYTDLSNTPSLATVATSGDYDDLTNKPTIPTVPTNVSAFTNDAGYVASTALATVATSGDYTDLSNTPTIPTKTSDLNNDSGFVTSSSLATVATTGDYDDLTNKPTIPTVPTNVSAFTNDAGYVPSTALATVATSGDYTDLNNKPTIPTKTSDLNNDSGFITSSILAAVATSGSYNDLTNKPTIPVVPTNVSAFTNDAGYINQIKTINNQSLIGTGNINISGSNVQSDWNETDPQADSYIQNKPTIPVVPTNVSAFTNDAGYLTQASLESDFVTTNTAQDITGTKTFVGEKKIKFSQSSASNKIGFTLSDDNGREVSTFEFRPNTITYSGVSHPLLYIGHYRNNAIASAGVPQTCVGFRQYDQANNAAYHFLMPLPEMAKTTFSLTTTFKDFYAPLGFKLDASTTKLADDDGLVDLSNCVTSTTTGLKIKVVSSMPASPDANTLYIVA